MKKTFYQAAAWGLAHLVFPRAKVKSDTPLDFNEPAVYVCNHSGAIGPALMTLYFKVPHKTWMINYVLNKEKNANFIFHDFFFGRSKKHKKFWRFLAKFVAVLLRPLLWLSDPIHVFHDKRMVNTFRDTLSAFEEGKSVVIFAECPTPFSEYVNGLYSGFADLGRSYLAATGKNLKFYPVYAEQKNRAIRIGEPIEYYDDGKRTPPSVRREEISEYIRDNIDKLARELPANKPIPFLPKAWYDYYGEYQSNPMEYWKTFD